MSIGMVIALIKKLGVTPDPSVIESAVDEYLEEHPEATCPIDDTAGEGDTDKVLSADKVTELVDTLSEAIAPLTPVATSGDVGKFLKAKTVSGGKVTEYEFGSGGGSAEIAGTSSDIGKALSPKTVVNNVVTEWQYLDPAPKWELINEETFTNSESATKAITADSYGNPIALTDMVLMFETPKQNDASAKTSPIVIYYDNNAKNIVTYVTAWTQAANAAANGCFVFVENHDGLVISKARQKSGSTGGSTAQYFYQEGFTGSDQGIVFENNFAISKVEIRGVTGTGHYVLYGKRKAQ